MGDAGPLDGSRDRGDARVADDATMGADASDGGIDSDAGALGDGGSGSDASTGEWVPPDPIAIEVPRDPDYTGLPRDAEGRPILHESATTRSVVRTERRPEDALIRCAHLVTSCFSASRSVDLCMVSAPRCTTAEPWNEPWCCPAACWDAYAAERRAGALATEALDRAFFTAPGCVPGSSEILELMETY